MNNLLSCKDKIPKNLLLAAIQVESKNNESSKLFGPQEFQEDSPTESDGGSSSSHKSFTPASPVDARCYTIPGIGLPKTQEELNNRIASLLGAVFETTGLSISGLKVTANSITFHEIEEDELEESERTESGGSSELIKFDSKSPGGTNPFLPAEKSISPIPEVSSMIQDFLAELEAGFYLTSITNKPLYVDRKKLTLTKESILLWETQPGWSKTKILREACKRDKVLRGKLGMVSWTDSLQNDP
ncbi:phosphoprotein [Charleville virus]|uniref:Phosphoprotein n=1 Tax=Charleville virus TaxID=318842 RepID=A0A3Q8TND7_9RHAB|nr:phosphoprotein [Charleville virus]AZL49334.1 phosphoprotein [Charleville virus]